MSTSSATESSGSRHFNFLSSRTRNPCSGEVTGAFLADSLGTEPTRPLEIFEGSGTAIAKKPIERLSGVHLPPSWSSLLSFSVRGRQLWPVGRKAMPTARVRGRGERNHPHDSSVCLIG